MTNEEFDIDLEEYLYSLFEIEKANLPRSRFAGIRSDKKNVKRTNNLRDKGFQLTKTNYGYLFKVDLAKIPYAQYIEENPKYITYHYWEKVAADIMSRIASRYNAA